MQGTALLGERTHHHCFSCMGWSFCFFQVQFPWGCHMSPQMDHYCLGNNVPNIEQRLRLGPATGELKSRITYRFGFLHVASLFTLAHIFREYRLQSSPHPTPWHTTAALFWNVSSSTIAWWTFLLVEENSLLVLPVRKHIPSKKLECVSVITARITPWSHGGRLFPFC